MTTSKILVVDDEPSIVEVVTIYLERSGYSVTTAADGKSALRSMAHEMPDLVILDLMLPEVDGLEITRRLRAEGNVPIIMLTARKEEADRVLGLELGADDYVVKPFSPMELVSRVRAVLRRTNSNGQEDNNEQPLTFSDMTINPVTRLIETNGQEIMLTAKEFDLLWLLASHPRQVFNRDQLLDRVWGQTEYIDPSTVTVHIRRLREKLAQDTSETEHIQTVWGVGYKFEP